MSDIELLTRQQVEKILGIRRSTVYKLVREGRLPTPIQISRAVCAGVAPNWKIVSILSLKHRRNRPVQIKKPAGTGNQS